MSLDCKHHTRASVRRERRVRERERREQESVREERARER